MMHHTQFSSQEAWSEISEFPEYMVSNWGRVLNSVTGVYITPTCKPQGYMMVGLMALNVAGDRRVQYKRSLPLLVARAFLPDPERENFDTPVHSDGDRSNNHAANLVWRPLWFSRKYMRQFTDGHPTCNDPIEDVETHEFYKSSMEASMVHVILDVDIVLAMHTNSYVWPTGQIFRKAANG